MLGLRGGMIRGGCFFRGDCLWNVSCSNIRGGALGNCSARIMCVLVYARELER